MRLLERIAQRMFRSQIERVLQDRWESIRDTDCASFEERFNEQLMVNAQLFKIASDKLIVKVSNPITTKTPISAVIQMQCPDKGWHKGAVEALANQLASILMRKFALITDHDPYVLNVSLLSRNTSAEAIRCELQTVVDLVRLHFKEGANAAAAKEEVLKKIGGIIKRLPEIEDTSHVEPRSE